MFTFLKINSAQLNWYIIIALVGVGILLILVSIILKNIRIILVPIKEGRPFEENIPTVLRKIAWISLICGILIQFMRFVENSLLMNAINIESLLIMDKIEKIEYTYTMDFSFVLLFAVIIVLSYIFQYGQTLQKESDETL